MLREFFTTQMDYLLFISGFALLLSAGLALALAGRKRDALPWRWFAYFALASALSEGVELYSVGLQDGPLLRAARCGLLIIASFSMFAFGRLGTRGGSGRRAGQWLLIPFLVAIGLGSFAGVTGMDVAARYGLGLIGGLWAAVAMWRAARGASPPSRVLMAAALLTGAFAATTCLAVPPAGLFPASSLNQDTFRDFVGQPLPFFRCLAAISLTVMIRLHGRPLRGPQGEIPNTGTVGRAELAVVLALIGIVLGGWVTTDSMGRMKDAQERGLKARQARMVAASIDPLQVNSLSGSPADLGTSGYVSLKQALTRMRKANSDCRFAYLVALKDDQVIFLADSEAEDSPDCSPPGQVYEEVTVAFRELVRSGTVLVEGPVGDRWGRWVSAVAAIRDLPGGRNLAALGLDINARDWDRNIARERLMPISVTLLIAVLVTGFFTANQRTRGLLGRVSVSEKRYHSLVEGSPICVQLFDGEGRCLAVNRQGLEKLGCTESAVIGKTFSQVWPGPARPPVEAAVKRVLSGKEASFEAEYTCPDGQALRWDVWLNPVLDDARRVRHFSCIGVDITARQKAEQALRKNNEIMVECLLREKHVSMQLEATMEQLAAASRDAQDANQAKSEFLANMSHEIRTPMTAILGYAELLAENCPRQCEFGRSNFADHAATITRNADHLLQIINDILDLSKIEAGKMEVEKVPCCPGQILEEVRSLMAIRAQPKNLQLDVESIGKIPEIIHSDPTRLRQVLINLVGNAIKFTDRGSVRVTVRLLPDPTGQKDPAAASGKPTCVPAAGRLQFQVIDTGIGLTPEQIGRLFQPFSQADGSTTRRFGGTGLGLSVSNRLVEMLGGRIDVESKPGVGSTFSVTVATGPLDGIRLIELIRSSPSSTPVSRGETPGGRRLHGRILLAEDGIDNQRLIAILLRKAGAEVAVVENGRIAIETAMLAAREGHPFDLIFMDMQMPEIDGYSAARSLREQNYAGPIIALTAHAMTGDRDKCIAAGCSDYVTKPINRARLLEAADRWMNRKACPVSP